ncbi:Odorant receptor Or82 [Rhyzopertha dominica]|nr:Odorant receptor Or82 [Rhyzopertha dominica]
MTPEHKRLEADCFQFVRNIMMLYHEHVWIGLLCKIYLPLFFATQATMLVVKGWDAIGFYDVATAIISTHGLVIVILIETVEGDIICLQSLMCEIFWSTNESSHNLRKDIKALNDLFKILIFSSVLGVIIFCSAVVFLHIYPEWPIVDKNNPIEYVSFLIAIVLFMVLAYTVAIVYAFMFFYFCIHAHVQMRLLNEYLRKVFEESKRENASDQFTRNSIVHVIKHHFLLTRFAKRFIQTFEGVRLAAPLFTTMLIYPLYFYCILYKDLYFVTFVFSMVNVFMTSLHGFMGELFSLEFENFTMELYNCKWYNWNTSNRRLLLLFLSFSQKERSVILFMQVRARTETLLWMFSKLYSLTALIQSVSE